MAGSLTPAHDKKEWWVILVILTSSFALWLVFFSVAAISKEKTSGQFDNVSPDVQNWFRSQKSPKTGSLCCNEADGVYAEEDIREGNYWTRFVANSVVVDWMKVPSDAVIMQPNPHGAPVVWWTFDKSGIAIRCYVPGGGV